MAQLDTCAVTEPDTSSVFAVDFGRSAFPAWIVIHMYHNSYPGTEIRLGIVDSYVEHYVKRKDQQKLICLRNLKYWRIVCRSNSFINSPKIS